MNHPTRSAIQAAIKALRECRELIQTDRTSLADSEMGPVTNTVPTDAKEMLDEYDSTLAHADDAVHLLTAMLSEPEAVQVPQGWQMVPVKPTQEMLRAGTGYGLTINTWNAMLAAAPQPPAQAQAKSEVEHLIAECIPGGSVCDPQEVADNIRRYCNACPDPAQAEARGDEPVAAQCRFRGESQWGWCSVEHHKAVQANPQDWPNYETRLVYPLPAQAAPQAGEAERERTKTLERWISATLATLESIDPDDMEDGWANLRSLLADGDALVSAVLRGAPLPASQPMSREAKG